MNELIHLQAQSSHDPVASQKPHLIPPLNISRWGLNFNINFGGGIQTIINR